MTDEERREIVNQVKEEMLLMIPEIIGNLITSHVSMLRLNKKLYGEYPEFASNKDSVKSIVEMIESQNPGMDYQRILDKAVPLIKERIRTVAPLNTSDVRRPQRNLSNLTLGNGEI